MKIPETRLREEAAEHEPGAANLAPLCAQMSSGNRFNPTLEEQ